MDQALLLYFQTSCSPSGNLKKSVPHQLCPHACDLSKLPKPAFTPLAAPQSKPRSSCTVWLPRHWIKSEIAGINYLWHLTGKIRFPESEYRIYGPWKWYPDEVSKDFWVACGCFSSCSRNSVKFLQTPTGFFNDHKYFLAVTMPFFLPDTPYRNWKYIRFLLISFADFSGVFWASVEPTQIWMRRCAETGGKFSGHICFSNSFDWHLIEIWVVHCVHTLSKKNWDIQEEIFMQLKHTCRDYRDNWKLKFPRVWYWEDCQSEYSLEKQQRCSPGRNQIKQLSMKSIHKGIPDPDTIAQEMD